MATQQALCRQRRAAARTVTFKRLHGVVRARRVEAARAAKKWTEEELVRAHQKQQQFCAEIAGPRNGRSAPVYFSALLSNSISSRSIATNGAVATELRG